MLMMYKKLRQSPLQIFFQGYQLDNVYINAQLFYLMELSKNSKSAVLTETN